MTNSSLIGRKYGRLTVLEVTSNRQRGRLRYACRCACECGTVKEYVTDALTIGKTKSCGCLNAELSASRNKRHGGARRKTGHLPEYGVWEGIKDRCRNPNSPSFYKYGERGITICDRWLNFAYFYADMGPRPSRDHSIDRIDNDGHYEPNNCRWATKIEQARNTRRTKWVVAWGERMPLVAALERSGINDTTYYHRLRIGMTPTQALEASKRTRNLLDRPVL